MHLVLATSLFKLPVAALNERMKIGSIKGLVIDTSKAHLMGFTVKKGLVSAPFFVSLENVVACDRFALVVRQNDDLAPIQEVVRAHTVYKQKINLIGITVRNQSKKKLGRVTDLAISLETGEIVNFYVHSLFKDRIINRSKVIEITKKALIVDDEAFVSDALPEAKTA